MVSEKTEQLWNALTDLNGGGYFEKLVDSPNKSLASHIDSLGIDGFCDELSMSCTECMEGYTEEAFRRSRKGKLEGSLSDLEKDQEDLVDAMDAFIESLKEDFPEHAQRIEESNGIY
jgi:hypothetical protein